MQQHYKGSTSTPPRVARLCQIREESLIAQNISKKKTTLAHMCRSFDSSNPPYPHSHSSPLYHLPGELVSLSSVPIPSIDLNLWNLSRPSAFVPISLGFTSVLTDDIVKSFRKNQILNEIRISCECVSSCDLLLVSLPLRVLCSCLLSSVSGMIVQSLSEKLARKSIQLTVHQEHTFLIRHWTKQQTTVLRTFNSSGELDQCNTECKMCFSSSLGHRPSQRQNIP